MSQGIGNAITALVAVIFDRGARDDDVIDRLNHLVMHGLLVALAVGTGSKQFVGSPIHCWVPAHYKEDFQKKYTNNHCWINSLYNIPIDQFIPVVEEKRYFNDVMFYRWATVIFLLLAFLFRVPQLLWRELKHLSGVNVDKLVGMTMETVLMDQEKRDKQLNHVAEFFHRWVTTRTRAQKNVHFPWARLPCGRRSGRSLVLLYLFTKFLYFLNTVGQFFIISSILKTNFWTYGLDVVATYSQQGEWENEDVFPRVALCDMKVRQLQNLQTYTMQCVLSINLFLEKMFFLLWFCLLFMFIANALSLAKWAFQLISDAQASHFLMNYLWHFAPELLTTHEDKKKFLELVLKYLQPDGLFVVRMISVNTTEMLTTDLLKQIWVRYNVEVPEKVFKNNPSEIKMNGRKASLLNKEGNGLKSV